MKKFQKVILFIILICLTTVSFSSCKSCNYQGYKGDYPELYTEAVYSILTANGYGNPGAESVGDPEIAVLETDEYGRVLFAYHEENHLFAICIAQKSDENFVYYYPDFNFIIKADYKYGYSNDINKYLANSFTEDDIKNLKTLNDFDKTFNESKCIKTAITHLKESPSINKNIEQKFKVLCKKYAKKCGCKGEDSVYRYANFCTYDDYGRMLFYIYGIHRDVNGEGISPTSKTKYFNLAIIFNSDWSYDETKCILEIMNISNYQDDLKEFKQLNYWNQLQ